MPDGREIVQLRRMVEEVSVSDAFYFAVDYHRPFNEMASLGRYLLRDGIVAEEHFPVIPNGNNGTIEFEAHYLSWPFPVSSEMAMGGIKTVGKKRSWLIAEIQHMFALGAIQPLGLHSRRSVVGFGSIAVIKGEYFVPCMRECASNWNLASSPLAREWAKRTDFLVVSKTRKIR